MAEEGTTAAPETSSGSRRLMILLAMAMFVLVVDTSLMNVSISAVVQDLGTTVSGVQSAIALEALVSAAFILIGSKVGDLIGRKRAYVLGLLGYAVGALAMTLAQGLTAVIIFWAIIGGLGASLLLPSMQSLVHGNFEGAAQRKAYALVGASAAIAAAVGPLLGGFITTYLSWRVGFALEVVIIAVVLFNIKLVRDAPYTGDRHVDPVGARPVGVRHGRHRAEHPRVAGGRRGRRRAPGARRGRPWPLLARGSCGASGSGKPALIDPSLFSSKVFRLGISSQMLQQIALGGMMIALPIYLQMVLEYSAMLSGLSIAPLSLSMFGVAVLAGKRAGTRRPSAIIRFGFALLVARHARADPDRAAGGFRLVAPDPAADRGIGARAAGVAAQQLHARRRSPRSA